MTDTNQEVRETAEVDACEYVLVPREPTQAMWAAFRNTDDPGNISFHAAYRAMVASAPPPAVPDAVVVREALDRFERAAMAYERLGKLTRDDAKTREIRKATIADLASARQELVRLSSIEPTPSPEPQASTSGEKA